MCGIAGAIGRMDGELEKSVRSMNDAQLHRGPDDTGLYSSQSNASGRGCVLGHRRLSIVDLSPLGHQPMVDEASGIALSYNGEIYNFKAIRDELIAEGFSFESTGDTEVLLKAWLAWGEDCVARLEGMFGFAVWDPHRESLFLARDRMGIKPVYYGFAESGAGDSFYFASELRALLGTGAVGRRMDPVALGTYLRNGFVVGPNTIVAGVRQLPAGSLMRIDSEGRIASVRRYWSIPDAGPQGSQGLSEAAAVEAVEARLKSAIEQRLVADVPLGIFLSGGVDSSAIAAMAQSTSESPITTFNISFDEARYDESPHAATVARTIGSDHREVKLSEETFIEGLPAALGSLDQPTFDAVNTFFVSRSVREAGLTVALAGTGGDELFGGYSSFKDLPKARRIMNALGLVPRGLRSGLGQAAVQGLLGRGAEVPPQTRWGKLADLISTDGSLLPLYQVSYALFTERFLESLIEQDGGASLVAGLPAEFAAELAERANRAPDLHGVSQLELALFLGERLLRDTDVASMAVSLEVRVPLVDHRLIEAVAGLPEHRRYEPIGRKALLRELGTRGIDPKVFDRPKAGFELPFDVWCRRRLRSEVEDTLLDPALCARVGLNAQSVAALWRAFCEDRPGIYWSRIWALYVLMWWSREYDIGL
ncbi:MAG: asparagine synthase (glutamine-hydrolyzing) [Myxococcota bacterium]